MPRAGPKNPVNITVWLGEIKKIYRKELTNIDFRTIQQHFLRQFANKIYLDLELKIIKVSEN